MKKIVCDRCGHAEEVSGSVVLQAVEKTWETPEEWEEREKRKLQDRDLLWLKHISWQRNSRGAIWFAGHYSTYKDCIENEFPDMQALVAKPGNGRPGEE